MQDTLVAVIHTSRTEKRFWCLMFIDPLLLRGTAIRELAEHLCCQQNNVTRHNPDRQRDALNM